MTNNLKMAKRQLFTIGGVVLVILVIAFSVANVWFAPLQAFRIVFGTLLTIFLPGFVMSFIFFPGAASVTRFEDGEPQERENHIAALDWIERITLSFALSLSTVPLVIYLSNRLGLPITAVSVFYLTSGIVIFCIAALLIKGRK